MAHLDVKESLGRFVTTDEATSVAEALTTLRESDGEFIMVTRKGKKPSEADLPLTVLRESGLVNVATNLTQKLSQLLKFLPPVVVLEETEFRDEDLSDVLTILGETESPGAVVRLKNKSIGIVPRASVARALPLEDIALVGAERGGMSVSARGYVCRKCVPHRRKRPAIGGTPHCDVWSHGLMDPA